MNGWYDDFDSLYDLYETTDTEIWVENYIYCIEQYGDDEHPRLIHITAIDYDAIPKGEYIYDEKYYVWEKDYENSFDFVNNCVLINGKTVAQMMCDANKWDYSILPVYPKWLDPLFGDIDPPDMTGETEEQIELRKKREKENLEAEKEKAYRENDIEEIERIEYLENIPDEEYQRIANEQVRDMHRKK